MISAGFMGAVVYVGYRVMGPVVGSNVATVISILAGAFVYGWMLINTGALTSEDFELIPKGKNIYRVLNKMKIGKW